MMIKDFLHQKQEHSLGKEEDDSKEKKMMKLRKMMENQELSLAPSRFFITAESNNSSSLNSDANNYRKRKHSWDQLEIDPMKQSSIELQLKDPLPSDWEQCLDLESGRMYYLNRKTLKKSYNWPKEQKIDLELNISTLSSADEKSTKMFEDSNKTNNSSNSMVALACLKCHLLVMLSKSSPSCPNCKYLHSLPTQQQSPPPKVASAKSLETLRLLN